MAVYDSQGRIFVKPGDMISKFHMSIYGNYGNSSTWPVFARPPKTSGGALQIIADYNRINAGETLIYSLKVSEVIELKRQGVIDKGMIPKVDSAVAAIKSGVAKVSFVDGRVDHSVLLEIFTDAGVGTEVVL